MFYVVKLSVVLINFFKLKGFLNPFECYKHINIYSESGFEISQQQEKLCEELMACKNNLIDSCPTILFWAFFIEEERKTISAPENKNYEDTAYEKVIPILLRVIPHERNKKDFEKQLLLLKLAAWAPDRKLVKPVLLEELDSEEWKSIVAAKTRYENKLPNLESICIEKYSYFDKDEQDTAKQIYNKFENEKIKPLKNKFIIAFIVSLIFWILVILSIGFAICYFFFVKLSEITPKAPNNQLKQKNLEKSQDKNSSKESKQNFNKNQAENINHNLIESNEEQEQDFERKENEKDVLDEKIVQQIVEKIFEQQGSVLENTSQTNETPETEELRVTEESLMNSNSLEEEQILENNTETEEKKPLLNENFSDQENTEAKDKNEENNKENQEENNQSTVSL